MHVSIDMTTETEQPFSMQGPAPQNHDNELSQQHSLNPGTPKCSDVIMTADIHVQFHSDHDCRYPCTV
jgi:hypothetical protein